MGTFAKLLIDKPVFSCQSLNILSQLCHFLGLQLGKLCLLFKLLSEVLALTPEVFDFLFSLKKFALVVVFFSSCDAHLVLDVTEVQALLLHLLLDSDKLFGLLVELSLHLI